jgi:hypothetical protein
MNTNNKRWYLGTLKNTQEAVYLQNFEWTCGWYWQGGCISNNNLHCHFDGCFLDVPDYRGHPLGNFTPQKMFNGSSIWEPLGFFLDNPQYSVEQWWRIKDLFKQFYALKTTAEVFLHGGNCMDGKDPRNITGEYNKEMADKINKHIETVIIPLIRKALNKE